MDSNLSSDIAVIIGSLIACAFCSGMEIAFLTSNKLKIELDKKQGVFGASIISNFTSKPKLFIASMLVGNNIALVVYGIVFGEVLTRWFTEYTPAFSAWAGIYGILVVQTIISTLVVLIFGEFIPKAVLSSQPNKWLLRLAIPLAIWYAVLYIFSYSVTKISEFVLRWVFKQDTDTGPLVFGRTDLNHYLENIGKVSQQQDLDLEIQFFQNALDFSLLKARDCMVPRNEIVALDLSESIDKLKRTFADTKLSKILIYRSNVDQLIGYVHFSDIFKNPTRIEEILKPIAIVPEAMAANEILKIFKTQKKSVAAVVDEFGGTSGLITFEDIIEEIFGEIEDEHDVMELIDIQLSETQFEFSGRQEVHFINEKYNLNLPENEDHYDTLGGLILHYHQDFPFENEEITIGDLRFTIKKMNEHQIVTVVLQVPDKED